MSASKTLLAIVITCFITMLVGTANAEARSKSRSYSSSKNTSTINRSKGADYRRNQSIAGIILLNTTRGMGADRECGVRVLKSQLKRTESVSRKAQARIMRESEAKIKRECVR